MDQEPKLLESLMKHLLILLSIVVGSTASAASNNIDEQYDYLETPVSNQIADLADQDLDGVINARDLCKNTPAGAEIDNNGCETYYEATEKKQLKVLFANNSTEISPLFITQVRTMAEFLTAYPDTSIELQGFASKTGNAEHNLALSKQRATNVRKALISYGVSHTRIKTVGFGDTITAAEGNTDTTHALNRRVVATVVGFHGEVAKEWTIFTTIAK